ncbi:uncharacterized protein LOC123298501 [Chrysoperla carnea]|uniref:uncharacterized protein LOC123298501 n=1 Tax=Chrysoperla carnea TaxID=189513 RepID=UPI001D07F25C|nr:uncharacterized protein LOC123298501 [Chrysoperla carnea]
MLHEESSKIDRSNIIENKIIEKNENLNDELEDILGKISDTSGNPDELSENELVINEREKVIINSLQDNVKEKATAAQAPKNLTIPRKSNNFDRKSTKVVQLETLKILDNVDASKIIENKIRDVTSIENSNIVSNSKEKVLLIENTETGGDLTKNIQEETMDIWENSSNDSLVIDLGEHENDEASTNSIESSNIVGNTPENENVRAIFNVKSLEIEDSSKKLLQSNTDEKTKENSNIQELQKVENSEKSLQSNVIEDSTENINLKVLNVEKSKKRLQNDTQDGTIENCNVGTSKTTNKAKKSVQNNVDVKICPVKNVENLEKADKNVQIDNKSEAKKLIRSKTSLQTIIDSKIIEGFYTEIGLRNRKVKITPPSQIQIKKRKLNNSEPKKIQELETSKNNLPNINVISKERAIALMKSKISKPTTQSIVIRNPKTKEVIKLQEQIDRPNLIEERSKIEQQTEKTYRRRGRKRKCPDQDIHKKDLENNLGIFPIPSKNVRIENVESINHEVQNSSNERNKGICSIQGENFRGENNHDLDNILIENNQKIYPIPSDNSQGINSNKEYTRVENGLDVQNNQRIKSDIQSENIRVENQPDIQTLNIQVENNQNLKEMVDIPIKNSLGAGKIEILENITIIPENGNEIMNQTEKFGNNKQTDNTVVFIENCENDSRIIPEYGDLEIDFTEGIEVDFTENQKTKEAIKLHQQIDRANLIEEQTDRSKNEKKQQNRKKCRRRGRKRKCPDQDIHKKDFENNVGILPISSKNILIKKVESVNHDIRNISNECNQGISSIQGENFRSEHNHDLDNILIENNQKIYPIPSDNGQNTQGIKSDTQSENIRIEHQPDIQTVNIQVGNNQNLKEMLDIPIGNSLGAEKIKILENITIEPENGNKIMNQTKKFENNEQTDNTIVFSENDSRTIPEYGDLEIDFTEGIEVDFTKNPKTKEVIKLQEQIDRANLIEEQTDRSKIKKQNGKKWRRRGRKRKCPDQDIHKKDLENNLGIFPIPSKNILIKNVESVNHDIRNISNECNKGICSIQDENFRGENNHDLDNILIENNQKIYPIPSDNSQNTQGVKSDTQSENIRVENQPNIQTINIQVGNNQNLKEMVDIPIENSLRAGKIEILENITIEPENGNEMNQTEKFGNNEQIDNTLDFIENCENDSRVILEYGDLELDFVEEIVIENTEKLNENKVVTSKVKHEVPKNNVIENCENDSRKISQYGDLEIDFTQDISIGLIPGKSKKPVVNTSKNSIKILRKYLKDDFTEDILVTTANQLNNLEPSKIADLILEEIIEDVCEKLNFEESPPAIPLTKIQQRLITLIYYLHDRENIPDFLNVMLSKLHKYLLDKFAPLFGLVRVIKMYISFCKLGNSFDKMRDLIWQIALVHQIKLPRLMYEILTNWPEVMPIYNEDKRNILIEVVFYTLLWDTSSIYGSYKKPLIDFIEGFYNYKRGKVIMMTLANDLLKEFKSNYSSNEPVTAILIFCKHHKGLDVYKFIIKNLLQNIKTCTQYFKSNKQCDMNVQNLAQRTVKLISQIDDVMVDQWDFTSEIVDCLLELIRACDGILCGQELDLKFFLKNFKNKDSANLNSKIVS